MDESTAPDGTFEPAARPEPVVESPDREAPPEEDEAGFEAGGHPFDSEWFGPATARHPLPSTSPLWDLHEPPVRAPASYGPTPHPLATAPPERRRVWWPMLGVAVLASALTVGVLAAAGFLDRSEPTTGQEAAAEILAIREIVTEDLGGSGIAAVGRKVTPSIVSIEIGNRTGTGFRATGGGSGVVIDSNGLIVTNEHVVGSTGDVQVVLHDGRSYRAEIVGADSSTDLAVLRIAGTGLVPIELRQTGDLAIGDSAIAVGNPLGLSGGASLTVGVVSALDRQVTAAGASTLYGMLQTDAPITQGSSGGALVDTRGRLMGITTAIGVSTAGAEGIGFAIPTEVMSRITDEIIDDGAVRHAFLGVELENQLDDRPDGATVPSGARVARLAGQDDTAAAVAGIRPGDVIVGFHGRSISTREELIGALRRLQVGDAVDVDIARNGTSITLTVVLGENMDLP